MRQTRRLVPIFRSPLAIATAALLGANLGACADDDKADPTPAAPATIAAIVAGNADFDTLEAALAAADLTETFEGDGAFTVFAPTDAAFEALPEGTLDALLADKAALTDILTYHVVSGEVPASAVIELDSATTLQGEDITIEVKDGKVILNGTVNVTTTDIEASNGIVHVIDAVLMPPEPVQTSNTIVDVVVGSDDFDTLEAAVLAADLATTLSGPGPFTVFAPTDAAFAALPAGALDALLADKAALTDVLTYHVVAGEVPAAEVVTLSSVTALNGVTVDIKVDGGAVLLNGTVRVTSTDIEADNGVIHVIDAVLLPPPTIADAAAADPQFSTLVTALDAADLVEALDGPGPFTVFAPTNDAFAKIPSADLTALIADKEGLTDVLLYHVIDGAKLAADVVGTPVHTMKNGAIVPVTLAGATAKIGAATITTTDIKLRNGVLHIIDTVIVPPPTLAEIAASNADFSTLLAAVSAAELATALDTLGPFTVFAPTNAAFAKIPEADLNGLLANKAALTNVLFYHVADGAVPASVAVTLDKATMKNGAELDFTYDATEMTLEVGGALVTGTDIWARNGVLHVIDTVLMPPMQ